MPWLNTVGDGSGTGRHMLGDMLGRARIYDDWTPSLQSDTAATLTKTFTVPTDTQWRVKWIWIQLTTAAGGSSRQLYVTIRDNAANTIAIVNAGVTQAGSLTYRYLFAPYVSDLTALRASTYLTTPIPEFVLPEAYDVYITASSAGADTATVYLMVESRPTPP